MKIRKNFENLLFLANDISEIEIIMLTYMIDLLKHSCNDSRGIIFNKSFYYANDLNKISQIKTLKKRKLFARKYINEIFEKHLHDRGLLFEKIFASLPSADRLKEYNNLVGTKIKKEEIIMLNAIQKSNSKIYTVLGEIRTKKQTVKVLFDKNCDNISPTSSVTITNYDLSIPISGYYTTNFWTYMLRVYYNNSLPKTTEILLKDIAFPLTATGLFKRITTNILPLFEKKLHDKEELKKIENEKTKAYLKYIFENENNFEKFIYDMIPDSKNQYSGSLIKSFLKENDFTSYKKNINTKKEIFEKISKEYQVNLNYPNISAFIEKINSFDK